MARFEFSGLDGMMAALEREAERVQRNGPAAVKAGAEALKAAMQQTVPVRTGGLRDHIKVRSPQYNSVDGHYCEIVPDGTDPHGERYATIGFVQEYGRSDMPAHPWMRPATESAGPAVNEAMRAEIFKD